MTLMYLFLYQLEQIISSTFFMEKGAYSPEEESRYLRVIMCARLKGLSGVQGQGKRTPHGISPHSQTSLCPPDVCY